MLQESDAGDVCAVLARAVERDQPPSGGSLARLLDIDPDLAKDLDDQGFAAARQQILAETLRLSVGPWRYPATGDQAKLGFLVLEGFLIRRVTVGRETGIELFGPGDVFAEARAQSEWAAVPYHEGWRVLAPARLAVLDREFRARATRWPGVLTEVLSRGLHPPNSVALQRAISQHQMLRTRLLLILWMLADRWGTVDTQGTVVPISLTHDLLAALTSARRPSVCTAMKTLADEGVVSRRRGSQWVLHGESPFADEFGVMGRPRDQRAWT